MGAMPDSPQYNRPDGTRQMAFLLRRDTGEVAFEMDETRADDGQYQQAVRMRDRAGNTVLADDTNSGAGLAVPWVPLTTPVDTNITTWPATTSTAWTGIATAWIQRQNPGMSWALWVQADPGTSGRVRMLVDGDVVATSPTVTGIFSTWGASYYWPDGWTFNSTATLSIEAIVTAGSGTVRATVLQLTGVQSA